MARSILLLLPFAALALAQVISTDTQVPPLQWINLTSLLQGTARPPPLKDAAIGYDEISRSIIIFGGESQNGFAQGQTYLLNLDTLSWSIPSPPPGLHQTPPARSGALAGGDFAASNRHAFVVVGGKGSNGRALSDVWAFDFNNQFWSPVSLSPGGPSPRWGASGGIDVRVAPVQDMVVPGPNNTLYLAGGTDGVTVHPLSEVWRLHIAGTLSSNLPNSSVGSWDQLSVDSFFPPRAGQGNTVINQQLVVAGGCDALPLNEACARQDSFVLNVDRRSGISPGPCPVPRLGPAMTPNLNPISSSFASQVFMLLGTFDKTRWDDSGGLDKGEVAILDINTGTWTRVLPSGDPGTLGRISFPSAREAASILSYQMGLVGPSRNSSADTIIFGGRDSDGNYLPEVWLLRAYTGVITPSKPEWEGFGNGRLQTGVAADGRGVKVGYLSRCASAISISTTISGSSTPSPTIPRGGTSNTASTGLLFETSLLHKIFATLSLITLQLVLLILRNSLWPPLTFICVVIGLSAYGLGIASIVLAFTTISTISDIGQHPSNHLQTAHGLGGLILFLCLYAVVPLWLFVNTCMRRLRGHTRGSHEAPVEPNMEEVAEDKSDQVLGRSRSAPQSLHNASPPSSPRLRTQSWGPSSLWRRSLEAGFSSDSESITSGAQRGFEVVNRPPRHRQAGNTGAPDPSVQPASRSLGEIDWLLRRRSLNLVGELDYALTQAHNARYSTPGTADIFLAPGDDPPPPRPNVKLPALPDLILHLVAHASILGLSVIILIALWTHASKVFFILSLIWMIGFYITQLFLAWSYRPQLSILSAIWFRLRNPPASNPLPENSMTPLPQSPVATHPLSAQNGGPYLHQPPYRVAATDDYSTSPVGPRSIDARDDDEIDEVTRQRIIEEEMDRREVSIVTVPKRRLWVTNPS